MIVRERHVLVGSDETDPERWMVLWTGGQRVALLDLLDQKSKPMLLASSAVEAAIMSEAWVIDPNPIEVSSTVGRELNEREKNARDRSWDLIRPLVEDVPAIFDRVRFGSLVAMRAADEGVSVNTIKAKLNLYWRGGMRIAALIPNFAARGPRGFLPAKPGAPKRGRKAGHSGDPHTDVTEDIQKAFQRAVDAHRKTARNRFTAHGAWKRFTEFECTDPVEDPDTGLISRVIKPEYAELPPPGYRQFKWWFDKTQQRQRVKRANKGAALYEKDNRATVGSSAAETSGPGSRFQIDATILEVALLSRHRPGDIIGKPVLYVVIDVWSRYVVGFYLGLTNASWAGAAMALANCLEPKDALLRKHGFDPAQHPWESRHLSAALLADGGEMKSHKGDVLASEFNCTVETAAPHRADWKGIVEQRFNITNVRIGPYVPGHVDTTYRGRGAQDYRFSARLTLDDLTSILIGLFLEYNNHHELVGLDLDDDVDAAGIPKIPAHLWRYGMEVRGEPRSFDHNAFRFAMMNTTMASITPSGILYRGRYYNCPELAMSGRLAGAREGWKKAKISWDDRIVGEIYWHNPESPTGYYVCRLTEKSRYAAAVDRSFWEIDDADDRRHAETTDRRNASLGNRADLSQHIEHVVAKAEEVFSEGPDRDDKERVSGLRDKRREERESDAASEAPPLADPAPEKSGARLKLVRNDVEPDDYSDLTLDDLEADDD